MSGAPNNANDNANVDLQIQVGSADNAYCNDQNRDDQLRDVSLHDNIATCTKLGWQ